MPTCDDLRLGGTLSATGIAGGISINGTAYSVTDWSEIFGAVGQSGGPVEVYGRPGSYFAGDGLPESRFPTLNLAILDRNTSGGLTEPTGPEQKEANTDAFLALAASRSEIPLEVTMADGTERFLLVRNLDAALIRQPRRLRTISIPLYAKNGWWKAAGNQSTDTINGADTLVVGGSVPVYDPVLVFAGDGTFTHSTLGWAITITGSSGAVTVDLGARTVTQASVPADGLFRLTPAPGMGRFWGWFTPGNNSVNSTVSTVVTWRDQWN